MTVRVRAAVVIPGGGNVAGNRATARAPDEGRRPRRGEGVCAGAAVGTAEARGGGGRAATTLKVLEGEAEQ
ncbi:hypothetical protein NOGI109294_00475 [Nocardiopsis gilva]